MYFCFLITATALYFLTYIFTIRGYSYLYRKFGLSRFTWATYFHIFITLILSAVVIFSLFLIVTSDDIAVALGRDILYVFITPYVVGPILIGISVYPLRNILGSVAVAPFYIGLLWILYCLYIIIFKTLGFHPIEFFGLPVLTPVLEALFVIASGLLFIRAANN